MKRQWLYRLHSADGELLYIGITGNPRQRIEQHRQRSPWFGRVASAAWVKVGADIKEARAIEAAAIADERPAHNVQHAVKQAPVRQIVPMVFTAEACEITGLHPSTFSRYVKDGTITPAGKGRGVRGAFLFRRSDVEALARRSVAA